MKKNKQKLYYAFVGLGFEILALAFLSLFLGQKLDEKWGSKGLVTIVLLFVALGVWVFHIVKLFQKLEKNEN